MSKPIVITAGHSEIDSGAVNTVTKDREADIVRDMRNMVAHYLTQENIPFLSDGTGLENLPLSKAIELAKKGCIAVEFHCNAAASEKAVGVEALSNIKHKGISQQLCQAVAIEMGNSLRGDLGWKPENSGQHSRLGFISKGNGIILELFFISNPRELATWKARKWLVAKRVAKVLIETYYKEHNHV